MKRLGFQAAILFLIAFPLSVLAQSQLLNFSPGAKALALGRTGVIEVYDPSALFWNPASLGALNANQITLAVHEPFVMNYAGYAHFFPLRGTFAIHAARTDQTQNAVEFGGFGWGFPLSRSLYTGVALNALQMDQESWASAGVGLLFKPQGFLKPPASALSSMIVDRLTLGACVQNIPIITPDYDHQIRLGASYAFIPNGFGILYGYHFQRELDTSHLGLFIEPHSGFRVYAGMKDMSAQQAGLGIEAVWENLTTNLSYDLQSERIACSVNFRHGASGEDLAKREYQKAREQLSDANKRHALRQAEKALIYDPENTLAKELFSTLEPLIEAEDKRIDSLLTVAKEMEKKQWFMLAAANYLKVLRLNPDHRTAKSAMALINPKLNIHTEHWYEIGVRYFRRGQIEHAKDIFESILLVRRDHAESRQYLAKINSMLRKQAEEHYFAGLGYYSQHQLTRAEKEFSDAVKLLPDYQDALDYLNRIKRDRQKNYKRITQLFLDAKRDEDAGSLAEAMKAYQQIFEIDPNHSLAKQKIADLRVKITAAAAQHFSRGEAAYARHDYESARRAFRAVIALQPDHAGALRYLGLIAESKTDKSQRYYALAQQYYNDGQLDDALATLDSLTTLNVNFPAARRLRERINSALGVERILEKGKSEMLSGNYLEARQSFNDVLEMRPNHAEAAELRRQCTDKLNEQVDEHFNRGIQLYTEEKYRAAIAEWEKALQINPNHKGSAEYKGKAEERLEALNRLP